MIESQGWIKLHRSILEWEWYKDVNTKALFFHLLVKANHKAKQFQGDTIQRGELVTGRKSLSVDLGLSEQQIRTSLNKLKSTNEITIKTNNKNSVISIINYDLYQALESEQPTTQPTSNQQTTNKQPTDNQRITTNKNVKNIKKERIEESIQLDSAENEFSSTTKKKKSIDERKSDFKILIDPFKEKYSSELLNEFWKYWTEKNDNGLKMRFETQKFFDVGRRLSTWKKNERTDKKPNRHEPSKEITSYGSL